MRTTDISGLRHQVKSLGRGGLFAGLLMLGGFIVIAVAILVFDRSANTPTTSERIAGLPVLSLADFSELNSSPFTYRREGDHIVVAFFADSGEAKTYRLDFGTNSVNEVESLLTKRLKNEDG